MPCRTLLFSIFKPNLIACYLKRCVLKMLVIFWVITPTPINLLINPVNPRSNTMYRAPVNVLCSCCHYFSTHRKLSLALISQELSERLLRLQSVHLGALLTLQWDYVYRTEVWSRFWLPPFLTPSLPTLQSPDHLQIILFPFIYSFFWNVEYIFVYFIT